MRLTTIDSHLLVLPRTAAYRTALLLLLATMLSAWISPPAKAATISFDLTCTLNGLATNGSCSPGPSFGTVTLTDLTGVDAGKVEVEVDLGFPASQKFRDLMLNYSGAATSITDDDAGNTVTLSADSFSIAPYNGLFDVGGTGGQGWSATTAGPYTTILSGDAALSTTDFTTLDSLGNLYAAIHIQDIGSATGGDCDGSGTKPACVPGMPGPGSLKIGAPSVIPEPTSAFLAFGALVGLIVATCRRGN